MLCSSDTGQHSCLLGLGGGPAPWTCTLWVGDISGSPISLCIHASALKVILPPFNSHIEVLTPNTSEFNVIWK